MHKSGFVALAMLILVIAVAILAFTMNDARHDTAHGPRRRRLWGADGVGCSTWAAADAQTKDNLLRDGLATRTLLYWCALLGVTDWTAAPTLLPPAEPSGPPFWTCRAGPVFAVRPTEAEPSRPRRHCCHRLNRRVRHFARRSTRSRSRLIPPAALRTRCRQHCRLSNPAGRNSQPAPTPQELRASLLQQLEETSS